MDGRLKQTLEWIALGLDKSDPALAAVIREWAPFFFVSALRVARVTGVDADDALGDILVAVVGVNSLYKKPLYRYKGALYHVVVEDGVAVHVSTPPANLKQRLFWTMKTNLESVTMGRMESMVYHQVKHHCVNATKASFSLKRGYGICLHEVSLDTVEEQQGEDSNIDTSVYPSMREIRTYINDIESDPESMLSVAQLVAGMTAGISTKALGVLTELLADPGISNAGISRRLTCTHKQAAAARLEILRTFMLMEGEDISTPCRTPVYIKADQLW